MGDLVFIDPDGSAKAILANDENHEVQDIVIYCQMCNEPIAITAKLGCDDVFLQCLKCHAVTNTHG